MSKVVLMSEKGQVTIPQEIRKRLKLSKGAPLLVDLDAAGDILFRPAAVYPIEIYTDERIREFEEANKMTDEERGRLKRTLGE